MQRDDIPKVSSQGKVNISADTRLSLHGALIGNQQGYTQYTRSQNKLNSNQLIEFLFKQENLTECVPQLLINAIEFIHQLEFPNKKNYLAKFARGLALRQSPHPFGYAELGLLCVANSNIASDQFQQGDDLLSQSALHQCPRALTYRAAFNLGLIHGNCSYNQEAANMLRVALEKKDPLAYKFSAIYIFSMAKKPLAENLKTLIKYCLEQHKSKGYSIEQELLKKFEGLDTIANEKTSIGQATLIVPTVDIQKLPDEFKKIKTIHQSLQRLTGYDLRLSELFEIPVITQEEKQAVIEYLRKSDDFRGQFEAALNRSKETILHQELLEVLANKYLIDNPDKLATDEYQAKIKAIIFNDMLKNHIEILLKHKSVDTINHNNSRVRLGDFLIQNEKIEDKILRFFFGENFRKIPEEYRNYLLKTKVVFRSLDFSTSNFCTNYNGVYSYRNSRQRTSITLSLRALFLFLNYGVFLHLYSNSNPNQSGTFHYSKSLRETIFKLPDSMRLTMEVVPDLSEIKALNTFYQEPIKTAFKNFETAFKDTPVIASLPLTIVKLLNSGFGNCHKKIMRHGVHDIVLQYPPLTKMETPSFDNIPLFFKYNTLLFKKLFNINIDFHRVPFTRNFTIGFVNNSSLENLNWLCELLNKICFYTLCSSWIEHRETIPGIIEEKKPKIKLPSKLHPNFDQTPYKTTHTEIQVTNWLQGILLISEDDAILRRTVIEYINADHYPRFISLKENQFGFIQVPSTRIFKYIFDMLNTYKEDPQSLPFIKPPEVTTDQDDVEMPTSTESDEKYYTFIRKLNHDPNNYKEEMARPLIDSHLLPMTLLIDGVTHPPYINKQTVNSPGLILRINKEESDDSFVLGAKNNIFSYRLKGHSELDCRPENEELPKLILNILQHSDKNDPQYKNVHLKYLTSIEDIALKIREIHERYWGLAPDQSTKEIIIDFISLYKRKHNTNKDEYVGNLFYQYALERGMNKTAACKIVRKRLEKYLDTPFSEFLKHYKIPTRTTSKRYFNNPNSILQHSELLFVFRKNKIADYLHMIEVPRTHQGIENALKLHEAVKEIFKKDLPFCFYDLFQGRLIPVTLERLEELHENKVFPSYIPPPRPTARTLLRRVNTSQGHQNSSQSKKITIPINITDLGNGKYRFFYEFQGKKITLDLDKDLMRVIMLHFKINSPGRYNLNVSYSNADLFLLLADPNFQEDAISNKLDAFRRIRRIITTISLKNFYSQTIPQPGAVITASTAPLHLLSTAQQSIQQVPAQTGPQAAPLLPNQTTGVKRAYSSQQTPLLAGLPQLFTAPQLAATPSAAKRARQNPPIVINPTRQIAVPATIPTSTVNAATAQGLYLAAQASGTNPQPMTQAQHQQALLQSTQQLLPAIQTVGSNPVPTTEAKRIAILQQSVTQFLAGLKKKKHQTGNGRQAPQSGTTGTTGFFPNPTNRQASTNGTAPPPTGNTQQQNFNKKQ